MAFWPQPIPAHLPWKSLTSIIEYYYMWKTTDRYVQQGLPPPHPTPILSPKGRKAPESPK
ncbi:hypothetical protein P7K49_018781 [Saguinus oedipus]|uniref:SANT domain-containing protein n=1 Tax=Saguinus oedipus TaxID=9490 RepID=A0ABQ9V793_SAGOE|nr:hypothetical protein P7K49_018781 [Saguinus oedipus]